MPEPVQIQRARHFLTGDLVELLQEMPTLHLLPVAAQVAWEVRKRDLLARIEALDAREGAIGLRSGDGDPLTEG